MEEQGMDRRNRIRRSRLLTGLFLLLLTGPLWPDPDALTLVVSLSPEIVRPGEAFTLSILVNHPAPRDLTVLAPDIPPDLMLESTRIEPRLVSGLVSHDERWTSVEYVFIPLRSGQIRLEPFRIRVPGKESATSHITIMVNGGDEPRLSSVPILEWSFLPAYLNQGRGTELTLTLSGWDPLRPLPEGEALRLEVPEGLIVEELPLDRAEVRRGRLLRLRIIPLEGPEIDLPRVFLDYGDIHIEAPRAKIPVRPMPGNGAEAGDGAVTGDRAATGDGAMAGDRAAGSGGSGYSDLFSANSGRVRLPFLRNSYMNFLEKARELWEKGDRAQFFAVLRRAERDEPFGPAVVVLRQQAEYAAGIEISGDESWNPRLFYVILIVLGGILLIPALILLVIKGRQAGEKEKKKAFSPSPLFFSFFLLGILMLASGLYGMGRAALNVSGLGSGRPAVVYPCSVHRIPDGTSAFSAEFPAGQPVRVRTEAHPWVYVESVDGKSGWTDSRNVIFY